MILWHLGLTLAIVWFALRGNTRVDYRFAAFGALLPDLIDKPLGRLLLPDRFGTGRLFGHTLLLNVGLLAILFFMRGRRKRQLTLVPVGSLLHLAQDAMWDKPRVFWWPLFGTGFPREPVDGGALGFLVQPLTSPGMLAQEAVGALLLVWLFAAHGMLSWRGVRSFLLTGRLEISEDHP